MGQYVYCFLLSLSLFQLVFAFPMIVILKGFSFTVKGQEAKGPKRFRADVPLSVSRSLWVPGSTLAQCCTLSSSLAGVRD